MNYFYFAFLGFLFGLAAASVSVFFLGRPTDGTSRISSIFQRRYIPVGPAYSSGFIPFACNCRFTVSGSLLSSFAMKAMVIKSSIHLYYRQLFSKSQQLFRNWDNLLNNYIGLFENSLKNYSEIGRICLINYSECGIIKV